MNDEEFIRAFENCTLPPVDFNHRNHIRAAWIYLQGGTLIEALERFSASLLRYASSLGKAHIYHATITWAYVFIIHDRMRGESTFDELAAANPDLFSWPVERSVVAKYYRAETIASDRARRTYVMPDRVTP